VKGGPVLVPVADPRRPMPERPAERGWAIESALQALDAEQRRLERLGFELPLARCREQRRFWEFVHAVHAMAPHESPAAAEPAWLRRIA